MINGLKKLSNGALFSATFHGIPIIVFQIERLIEMFVIGALGGKGGLDGDDWHSFLPGNSKRFTQSCLVNLLKVLFEGGVLACDCDPCDWAFFFALDTVAAA